MKILHSLRAKLGVKKAFSEKLCRRKVHLVYTLSGYSLLLPCVVLGNRYSRPCRKMLNSLPMSNAKLSNMLIYDWMNSARIRYNVLLSEHVKLYGSK